MGPAEAASNLKKHGVDFADAATVLHDEQAITIRDDEGDEERYVTIGMDALGNVLVVVYTWRGERPASYLLVKQRRKSASSTR